LTVSLSPCQPRSTFSAGIVIPVLTAQVAPAGRNPTVPALKFLHLACFKKAIQAFGSNHVKTVIDVLHSDQHDNPLSTRFLRSGIAEFQSETSIKHATSYLSVIIGSCIGTRQALPVSVNYIDKIPGRLSRLNGLFEISGRFG
jgi:hypothetical protein